MAPNVLADVPGLGGVGNESLEVHRAARSELNLTRLPKCTTQIPDFAPFLSGTLGGACYGGATGPRPSPGVTGHFSS